MITVQPLKKEIKYLRRHGEIVGISKKEDVLNRRMNTAPHLIKTTQNATKLHKKLLLHCDGNPYTNGIALKSIISSAIIPNKSTEHILNLARQMNNRYEKLVNERLFFNSTKPVWDKHTRLTPKKL